MAMKQFNLEEYFVNPSRKVITRDGRPVKIHCTNFASDNPVIATMGDDEYSYSFSRDGKFIKDINESDHDLFFTSEKHEGWLNVYRYTDTGEVTFGAILHTSREKAEKIGRANGYYAATAKIEWEE